MISASLSFSVKAANERIPETVYPRCVKAVTWCSARRVFDCKSKCVFICVRAIEIIILTQRLSRVGYLAYPIGSKCVQRRRNKQLCVWDRAQSFHLHNNEVGSEAIGSVCLPPNCAHVLMDSVLHYFAEPRIITEASITKNRARGHGSMCACLSAFVRRWWNSAATQL